MVGRARSIVPVPPAERRVSLTTRIAAICTANVCEVPGRSVDFSPNAVQLGVTSLSHLEPMRILTAGPFAALRVRMSHT